MTRLYLLVEGETEATFVRDVLAPYLGTQGVYATARVVEISRKRSKINNSFTIRRGGLLDYERAKGDVVRWMKEDGNRDVRFSTMFDLYALPNNFPGYAEASKKADCYSRIAELEEAFSKDVRQELDDPRFIPYLQLHEFEALLLSDPMQLAVEFLDQPEAINKLASEIQSFKSPEMIDDDPATAPSKRIIKWIPEYKGRKASAGPIVAETIGLPRIREKCSHFHQWLEKLESLGKE